MNFAINECYKPFFEQQKRYNILLGARASGKSTVVSQFGVITLIDEPYSRAAIMRNVGATIRSSIYQEVLDRISEQNLEEYIRVNSTLMSFFYKQNSIAAKAFRQSSGENTAKMKSLANFTHVYIDEAEEINENDFMKLDDTLRSIRSDIKIFLVLNPPESPKHWVIERFFNLVDTEHKNYYFPVLKKECEHNTLYVHSTYKDNVRNLSQEVINNYENYRITHPDHYKRMILGLVGSGNTGRVFTGWQPISQNEFRELDYPSVYGLDFGFSSDPIALVEVKKHNEKIFVNELIYQTGLTDSDLANKIKNMGIGGREQIIADSAQPQSIETLRRLGLNVKPAKKGVDSVMFGIKNIQSHKVFYTENSKNLANEYYSYCWQLDRDGNPTDKPIDKCNHTLDALRYSLDLRMNSVNARLLF